MLKEGNLHEVVSEGGLELWQIVALKIPRAAHAPSIGHLAGRERVTRDLFPA